MLICIHFTIQVPPTWRSFLTDQRGPRLLQGVLNSRTLSLRAGTCRERQDMETRERIRYRLEEMSRKEMVEKERIQRSQAETNELFLTVPSEDAISEEHQSNLEQEDTAENTGDSDSIKLILYTKSLIKLLLNI